MELRKVLFLVLRKFLSKTVAELANSVSLGRYCDCARAWESRRIS